MSTQFVVSYLALIFFCTNAVIVMQEQQTDPRFVPAGRIQYPDCASADDEFTHIFLYYPLENSASGFSVFMNRKSIGKIMNGGRIECKLLLEGPVAVTITEGSTYREPLTLSRNSRTITVKKGKSYYFRINKAGELEYMFITSRGEKGFAEAKDFVSQPTAYTETTESAIPTLSAVTN